MHITKDRKTVNNLWADINASLIPFELLARLVNKGKKYAIFQTSLRTYHFRTFELNAENIQKNAP
jgi:hypothetical protein